MALWNTAVAPSARGVVFAGVAKVLSQTSRAPARFAISATAAMSTMSSVGFAGVSTTTTFVLGRIAAS